MKRKLPTTVLPQPTMRGGKQEEAGIATIKTVGTKEVSKLVFLPCQVLEVCRDVEDGVVARKSRCGWNLLEFLMTLMLISSAPR